MQFPSPVYELIRERCNSLQLSIEHVQRLSAATGYVGSEALFWTIGLDHKTCKEIKSRDWLQMVAQNCSVSYIGVLESRGLADIMTSGNVPDQFLAHIMHLLDETPIQMAVLAAEQASRQSDVPLRQIWANLSRFASELGAHRRDAWNPRTAAGEGRK